SAIYTPPSAMRGGCRFGGSLYGGDSQSLSRPGRRERRAAHAGLDGGDGVPVERDLDLALLPRPPADGCQPPGQPWILRDDPARAVEDRASIRRGELLVLLGLAAADFQDVLVGRGAGHDAPERFP